MPGTACRAGGALVSTSTTVVIIDIQVRALPFAALIEALMLACTTVVPVIEYVNAIAATAKAQFTTRWVAVPALADGLDTVWRPFGADVAAVIAVPRVTAEIDTLSVTAPVRLLARWVAGLAALPVLASLVISTANSAAATVLVIGADAVADAVPAVGEGRTLHTARAASVDTRCEVPAVLATAGAPGAAKVGVAGVLTFSGAQADTHRSSTGSHAPRPGADDAGLVPLLARLDEL